MDRKKVFEFCLIEYFEENLSEWKVKYLHDSVTKKLELRISPPLTKFAQHVQIISVSIKTIFFIFRGKPFDGINNFECISHKIQL